MRVTTVTLSALFAGLLSVTSAQAQSRWGDVGDPVPAPGMVAIGASFGAAPSLEASFTNGPLLAGNIEGYLSRRVSLRGQISGAFWDITGRGFTGTVRPLAFNGNVVYNWEGGRVHPFATGGVGLYRYRFDERPALGSTNKAGVNLGGGLEYFINRRATATTEVLFHRLNSPVASPLATFEKASYWTLSAGLKKYF